MRYNPTKIAAAVAAATIAVVALSACEVDDTSSKSDTKGASTGVLNDADEAKDVKLLGLDNQGFGISAAKIKVTNSSSKTSDYMVEVSAESKDGKRQYDSSTALVMNIKPGQTTVDTSAMFTKKIPATAVLTVGSVDRSESL